MELQIILGKQQKQKKDQKLVNYHIETNELYKSLNKFSINKEKKEMPNSKTYCWYPHFTSTKTLHTEFTISSVQLANCPLRHSTHMKDKKSSPT